MRLFTTTAVAAVLAVPGMAIAQTETDERIGVEVEEAENIERVEQQTEEGQQAESEAVQIEGAQQTGEVEQTEGGMQRPALKASQIVALTGWDYEENIYAQGWSADEFIDGMEVHGAAGDDIGDVEDLIVDADGKLVAVIAEIGGVWDIGDTHVSIPWDQIEVDFNQQRVRVPVTEENVDDYEPTDPGAFPLEPEQAAEQVAAGVDDVPTGQQAFRVSDLIGDYARIRAKDGQQQMQQTQSGEQGEQIGQQTQQAAPTGMMAAPGMAPQGMMDYGYVNDVVIRDDEIAAIVVQPRGAYGPGYRAYPYYGYGAGWRPGNRYYDMPYTDDEVGGLEEFDYGELEYQAEQD